MSRELLNSYDIEICQLEEQISHIQGSVQGILEPLFKAQHSLAHSIAQEPEFAEIEKGWIGSHPKWNLCDLGTYGHTYSYFNGSAQLTSEYSDGERTGCSLLPEFIDGGIEAGAEAVREYYRKFLSEKNLDKERKKQKEVEKAMATLREAGLL